jgi:HAMP domain-containing protein
MLLRTRLLLGYGYLVGILVLVAVAGLMGLHAVEHDAVDQTQPRIERLDTLVRLLSEASHLRIAAEDLIVDGATPAELSAFATSEASLRRRLTALRGDAAASGAMQDALLPDALARFIESHDSAEAAADPSIETYRSRVDAVHDALVTAIEVDRAHHLEASRAALARVHGTTLRWSLIAGVLVTAALLSLGLITRSLQRDLLARLEAIRRFHSDIEGGDSRRRLDPMRDDELGAAARLANESLDREARLRAKAAGEFAEQRELTLGFLAREPQPMAVFGLDGLLLADTMDGEDRKRLAGLAKLVRDTGRTLMQRTGSGDSSVTEFAIDASTRGRLELLRSEEGRNVGLLLSMWRFDE